MNIEDAQTLLSRLKSYDDGTAAKILWDALTDEWIAGYAAAAERARAHSLRVPSGMTHAEVRGKYGEERREMSEDERLRKQFPREA